MWKQHNFNNPWVKEIKIKLREHFKHDENEKNIKIWDATKAIFRE